MRLTILAAVAATAMLPGLSATAQTPAQTQREYNRDIRDARQEYREDLRGADNRRDVRDARQEYRENIRDARQDARQDTRDWRQFRNYDYNRLPRGQRAYFADQYYRDGRYYQPRRLTRNDRIYRGQDNRYYCRRSDGTTGLIIGGLSGAVLGNSIAGGGSRTLGALLGGTAGAVLGQSIDRNGVRCR